MLSAELKTCAVCSKSLSRIQILHSNKCCSLHCRGIFRTSTAVEKHKDATCWVCGKPLTMLQACKKHRYCSIDCYNVTRKVNSVKKKYWICLQCGKAISKDQYWAGNKFCSPACATANTLEWHDYGYNTSFVADTDSETFSYFLGLWVADGYMSPKKQVTLKLTDEQIIRDVARAVGYYRNINFCKPRTQTCKPQYELSFAGSLADKLISFGYPAGPKTGKEFLPECINKKNILPFVRGLIDGDGNLDVSKPRGYLTISISVQSKKFLLDVLNALRKYEFVGNGSVYKSANIHILRLSHYDSMSLCKHMYKDASLFLERKYKKFESCSVNMIRRPKWIGEENGIFQNWQS